jgi:hypothetical protein
LNFVYKPPVQYDNYIRLNVKLTGLKGLAIEGNKRFKTEGHKENFNYYDTIEIKFPEQTSEFSNKIYMQFENSLSKDSLLLVVSKSAEKNLFWKQIFYSSVIIEKLNKFSDNPNEFRINENSLVEQPVLENNDTLINKAINYFESNKERLSAPDCGTNSLHFTEICSKYNLPSRIVGLQGGDGDQTGFNNNVGYPLHVVCEVYSSKYKKWYVIDPTFGFRFKNTGSEDYLSAVEISNMFYFMREKFIIQDSVFTTRRSILGRDYFKYYENVYFKHDLQLIKPVQKFLQIFYKKFIFDTYHYTNYLIPLKNGYYYTIIKSFVYLLLILLYFNVILLIILRRLFSVKKPNNI